MLSIVLNRCNLVYLDTNFVQFLAYEGGIGIYNLPDENLITYGDYFSQHLFQVKIGF